MDALEKFDADHGSAVVMETKTGKIKAISNLGKTSDNKYYEKKLTLRYKVGSPIRISSAIFVFFSKLHSSFVWVEYLSMSQTSLLKIVDPYILSRSYETKNTLRNLAGLEMQFWLGNEYY